MDLGSIPSWVAIVISSSALAYTVLSNRSRAYQAEVKDLRENVALADARVGAKVEVLEDRVSKVEGELRHLPAKDDVHQVQLALKDLQGEVRAMAAQMAPIGQIANRLQDHLLEEAKSR